MTDEQEHLIAAAKASLDTAENLALPSDDPARGVAYDARQHIERIEKSLRRSEGANREMREAVIRYSRRLTWLIRLMLVLGFVGAAVVYLAFSQLNGIAHDNRANQVAASTQARVVIGQTCQRANGKTAVLRGLIVGGRSTLKAYVREGTLTRAQYVRALRDSRRAERALSDDDCAALARRIPIPGAAR